MLSVEKHKSLLAHARAVKLRFLSMYQAANAGHVGCSLSCAEILVATMFDAMHPTDEIILSKGHAAAALYAVLAEASYISDADVATFYKNNTYLAAHPPTNKLKGIPFATGSLGHGLSLAAGIGMAVKLKQKSKRIFCVTSDGEINEGSTWEAALFIAHHQLKHVLWLIDRNQLQGYGRTEDVLRLEPLADKIAAFGFDVKLCNGHSFSELHEAIHAPLFSQPRAIICNTIKGHNWTAYEDKLDCHYLPMKDGQYELIQAQVEQHYQSQLMAIS